MDNQKIGSLLLQLRKELRMTQKEVALQLHISDKTVSKWECGQGLPDISLLAKLAKLYNVHLESLLIGEQLESQAIGLTMKKAKFYVCPSCGNIINAMSDIWWLLVVSVA